MTCNVATGRVVPWSEISIDGVAAAPLSAVGPGALWMWTGLAVPSGDGGTAGFRAVGLVETREIGRLYLSDGTRTYAAAITLSPLSATPALVFDGPLPRSNRSCEVIDLSYGNGSDRVICFTSGTAIETDRGLRPVEDVRPGDRLWTLDDGYREVLWTGHRRISGSALAAAPALRPVLVRGGTSDVLVSPDHRILRRVRSGPDGRPEDRLVAARHLDAGDARRVLLPKGVVYVHLMLETHQIVRAGGLESESFHPAAMPLTALRTEDRAALIEIRPDLVETPDRYGPTARALA